MSETVDDTTESLVRVSDDEDPETATESSASSSRKMSETADDTPKSLVRVSDDEDNPQTATESSASSSLSSQGYWKDAHSHSYGSTWSYDMEAPVDIIRPSSSKWFLCFPVWLKDESKAALKLAWPMIMTTIFSFLQSPIALIFCGTLGPVSLAGASLAATAINVFGAIIGVGMGSALDTLISQTYGANNKIKIGILVQRGLIIMMLTVIPCLVIHLNITTIFMLLGQDRETAIIAGDYLLYFIPGLIMNFTYLVITKYLTNQSKVLPNIFFGIAGTAVNCLSHYLLVIIGGYGIIGSSLSQVLAYAVMNVSALLYIRISGFYEDNWQGWSIDCLKEWGQFLSLSIPGLVMTFVEWGSFEVATIVSGLFGVVQLDAQTVAFQVTIIIFMVPLGFSIAANIRVGQLLGGGDSLSAKRAAISCLGMVVCTAAVISLLLGTLRNFIPRAFTQNQDVIDIASVILIILAGYEVMDSIASVMAGILRGSGRQLIGAIILFIGYIVVAQPIGMCLMFLTELKTIGFWLGIVAGLIVVNIAYALIFFTTNWDKLSLEAQKRAGYKAPQTETFEDSYTGSEKTLNEDAEKTSYSSSETDALLSKKDSERRYRPDGSRKISSTGAQSSEETKRYLIFTRSLVFALFLMLLAIGVYLRFTLQVERCVFPPVNGSQPIFNSSLPFCSGNSKGFIFDTP